VIESFSLQSQDSDLSSLWSREPLELWSAGAALTTMPSGFESGEGQMLLVRGRLRLDADEILEGPALVFLDPGVRVLPQPLDARVRILLWAMQSRQQRAGSRATPRILRRNDLDQPRTVTTAAALVHWLPRLQAPARRTLAGAPSLLLNLGHAPLPLVSAGDLLALAGGAGAVCDEVITLQLRPGTGPLLAVERLEVAPLRDES